MDIKERKRSLKIELIRLHQEIKIKDSIFLQNSRLYLQHENFNHRR